MTAETSTRQHLLTFQSGGWVLLLGAVVTIAITAWALAGAFARNRTPLIGDGTNVETYGFDLTPCLVAREQLVAAGMCKDALRSLVDPPVVAGSEVEGINRRQRGKFLVSTDRVIGVTVNGASRAYPIQILNCHEIVNDTLGGVPIVVTYNPPCDSAVAFERTVGGETLEFGVSGLLYNSNLLMYDRREASAGESLWCQLLGAAIAGPAAADERRLTLIDTALVAWEDWLDAHPDTTVVDRDPKKIKLYKQTSYDNYFQSPRLHFPVDPLPPEGGPRAKDRVVVVSTDRIRAVYPLADIARRAGADGSYQATLDGTAVQFRYRADPETVVVSAGGDTPIRAVHSFWFAWHAMHPDDELALQ
ncbi:MAG: DUF3179 domain-containing (seleno)protein [Planctomycetota bacterium]|jgi:hypothetical protein